MRFFLKILPFLAMFALNAKAMTTEELRTAVRAEVQSCVVSIKNSKTLFHWTSADYATGYRAEQSFVPTEDVFRAYVSGAGALALGERAKDTDDLMLGLGIYFANGPAISRSFSKAENFGLVVATLNPGSKIYLHKCHDKFSKPLKAELEAANCKAKNADEVLLGFEQNCLEAKKLLIGEDFSFIQAIAYNWNDSKPVGCKGLRKISKEIIKPKGFPKTDLFIDQQDTLVVYDDKTFKNILGFTGRTTSENATEQLQLLRYLKTTQAKDKALQRYVSEEILNNSEITTMSEAEEIEFNRVNLLGCK